MALNDKAMKRLVDLGVGPDKGLQFWQRLWDSEGESFFWSFLEKEEEAAQEYHRWYPQLQAFSAECRQKLPVPTIADFSAVELEQYRILLSKMLEFAASEDRDRILGRKPNCVSIFTTTRVGLLAAQEVFAGSGAVVLEASERERWFSEVYHPNNEAFWWYVFAWWTLQVGLPTKDEESIRRSYPIAAGREYWVVETGQQWGGLAGGANHELWQWDGTQAEFIELYSVETY